MIVRQFCSCHKYLFVSDSSLLSDYFFKKLSVSAELVVAAAEAVVVKDKSDGKKKKKARRLRNVEINDKAGGWVKD